jgi:hypothetical protein
MKDLYEFLKKALSKNNEPSSSRVNVFYSIVQWVPAITISFLYVTFAYKDLILPYAAIIMGSLNLLFGIKVVEAIKKPKEASDEIEAK